MHFALGLVEFAQIQIRGVGIKLDIELVDIDLNMEQLKRCLVAARILLLTILVFKTIIEVVFAILTGVITLNAAEGSGDATNTSITEIEDAYPTSIIALFALIRFPGIICARKCSMEHYLARILHKDVFIALRSLLHVAGKSRLLSRHPCAEIGRQENRMVALFLAVIGKDCPAAVALRDANNYAATWCRTWGIYAVFLVRIWVAL